MPGFLYWVEGLEGKPSGEVLSSAGLGHVCGAELVWLPVPREGAQGVMFGLREGLRLEQLRFDGGAEWVTVRGERINHEGHEGHEGARLAARGGQEEAAGTAGLPAGRVMVGLERGARPGPGDLMRPALLDGELVTLGDGNRWRVPVARAYVMDAAGECAGVEVKLPTRSRLDYATGRWVPGGIAPDYQALWEIAMRWIGALGGGAEAAGTAALPDGDSERFVFDFSGGHEAAVVVLGANYRVGPVEVDLLGLLGSAEVKAIMWALCGMSAYDRAVKKKLCGRASS